ncbi:MAG: alpha/beta hydrolase [Nitrospiraceae bacterium]|nr:alpha/beta hydrolase [Nitrospiraceae bacterium]
MANKSTSVRLLERVSIGNDRQWVLVRGGRRDLPVLLILQAGPGFPIIHEVDALQKRLRWEDAYRVVYWDMRGCGKSSHPDVSFGDAPLERLVLDIREVIDFLLERLEVSELSLLRFSLGASLSVLAARRSPKGVHALIGVGSDICLAESEPMAQDFLWQEAIRRNHKKALGVLGKLGDPPYARSAPFMERAKWMTAFGAIHRTERYGSLLLKNLWRLFSSPDYSVKEAFRALGGLSAVQDALLPAMKDLDLFQQAPKLDVPIILVQGRHDKVAPGLLTRRYFDLLDAPEGKMLLWFESSAHMPHYEEPGRFAALMKEMGVSMTGQAGQDQKNFGRKVIDR